MSVLCINPIDIFDYIGLSLEENHYKARLNIIDIKDDIKSKKEVIKEKKAKVKELDKKKTEKGNVDFKEMDPEKIIEIKPDEVIEDAQFKEVVEPEISNDEIINQLKKQGKLKKIYDNDGSIIAEVSEIPPVITAGEKYNNAIKNIIEDISLGSKLQTKILEEAAKNADYCINYAIYCMTAITKINLITIDIESGSFINGVAKLAGRDQIYHQAPVADLELYDPASDKYLGERQAKFLVSIENLKEYLSVIGK